MLNFDEISSDLFIWIASTSTYKWWALFHLNHCRGGSYNNLFDQMSSHFTVQKTGCYLLICESSLLLAVPRSYNYQQFGDMTGAMTDWHRFIYLTIVWMNNNFCCCRHSSASAASSPRTCTLPSAQRSIMAMEQDPGWQFLRQSPDQVPMDSLSQAFFC